MYNGTVQFLIVLSAKLLTISLHRIKTYKEVTTDGISLGIVNSTAYLLKNR